MLQTLLQTASCALAAMSHSAPPQSIHTVSCPGLLQGLLHHLSRLTLPALQQGREKDVVIFSAVRTRRRGGIGFVADERRINVGLTRARSSLLVLGNAGALEKDAVWASLIRHARDTGSAPGVCAQRTSGSLLDDGWG